MKHQNQAIGWQEWDDLDLAPEDTPYALSAGSNFRNRITQAADDPMGQFPSVSVEVFTDLGLSGLEIARYFGVSEKRIIGLKNGEDQHAPKNHLGKRAETT